MSRVSVWVGAAFLGAAFLLGSTGLSQDKDKKDKVRGTLPPGMGKLGLSADQKKAIYDIHAKYQDKLKALEKQIGELKSQRQGDYFKVLTKDQQEAYLKALTGGTKKGETVRDKKEKN